MFYERGRVYIVDLDAAQCDSVTYRHPPLSISVTEDDDERKVAKSVQTNSAIIPGITLFQLFPPTGDSSRFMCQLVNKPPGWD